MPSVKIAIHVLVLNKIQTNWRTAAVKRRKNVVVETDGYLALIEHLSFNMDVFTQEGDTGTESVEDVITDMVASNIMSIFEQNPELHSSVRFQLLKEADSVVEDLGEVLAGVWHRPATNEQIAFLDEYIALVKNLFDSAVAKYD
ncbi:hypothetical protein A5A_021800 [Vibrio cholerae MZO-2]|nr:DUF3802 family protein [Vibrio cholerae]KNA46384.1 hypothetical protein A5A_021800 [Vibrio cholerae MZO-2]